LRLGKARAGVAGGTVCPWDGLVTTHNPAALDGLNLNDEDQRLFVVYRNDEGPPRRAGSR
jgi:hypothetical protein